MTVNRALEVSMLLLAFGAVSACAGRQELVPETAPSTGSPAYAAEFPDRLAALRQRYVEQTKQAREETKTFGAMPDELEEPDWDLVADLIARADKAGRSQAIVDALREERAIRDFLAESDRDIARRIGVHVNSALKQQGGTCEYQTGPSTIRALNDGVDRQLEDRYRGLSEAHQLLAQRAEDLNKRDVEALEGQIDRVTKTSFIVYVDAVMLRDELDRLLEEVEAVGETLDEAIALERQAVNDAEASKNQKQAAAERLERLQAAKTPLTGLEHNAQTTRERIDEDVVELRTTYEAALQKLLGDVASRASKAAP